MTRCIVSPQAVLLSSSLLPNLVSADVVRIVLRPLPLCHDDWLETMKRSVDHVHGRIAIAWRRLVKWVHLLRPIGRTHRSRDHILWNM